MKRHGIDKMLLLFTHELNELAKVCLSVLFIMKSNIFNIQTFIDSHDKCVDLSRWQELAGLNLEQCRKSQSVIETHCHLACYLHVT